LTEVTVSLAKVVPTGQDFDFSYTIGVAFAGNTISASASLDTFKHVVARLSGNKPGIGPSLSELVKVLREIYLFHRNELRSHGGAISNDNWNTSFVIAGYCHSTSQGKIFHINNDESATCSEHIEIDPLIIGADQIEIKSLISEYRALKPYRTLPWYRAPLAVMQTFCESTASRVATGGNISFGACGVAHHHFQKYALSDFSLLESQIDYRMTVNGFDTKALKGLLEEYYFFGFALEATPFSERYAKLKGLLNT
jgi:hypothetical protein